MMDIEKIEQLCAGCFSQQEKKGTFCPVCGYNATSQENLPHQLPPKTILNEKYLVGKVLGEGGFGITYIGYDLNLDMKVAIKEYFPYGTVIRTATDSNTVRPVSNATQGDLFLKGREWFVDEAKRLAKFHKLSGIVMVYNLL